MSSYDAPHITERDHLQKGNILYFINQYPGYGYNAGGAERHLQLLTTNLRSKYEGVYSTKVFVARSATPGENPEESGVIAHPSMVKFLRHLYRHQNGIDILHLGNFNLLKRIFPFVALRAFWRKPIICRVTSTGRMNKLLAIPSFGRTYTQPITTFISQSQEITDQLCQLGIDQDRVVEIDNGVDTSMFYPLKSRAEKLAQRTKILPGANNGTTYINVGRISKPEKKVDELLDAWEHSRLYEKGDSLVLAGPVITGDMTREMKHYYEKFQDGRYNVTWTQGLEHNQVRDLLQISDVFVTASDNEGFSNAALEAMACGLPVIGRYGVSGHSKIIQEGVTGMYFDDTASLCESLMNMRDTDFNTSLGVNAALHVRSNFGIDQMLEQYNGLYQDTLRKNR